MLPRLLLTGACCLTAFALSACGDSSDDSGTTEPAAAEWSYGGANGPAHWGELDDRYELCAAGDRQSPINLTDAQRASFPRVTINYVPEHLEVEDNGHSVEAEIIDPESSIEVAGTEYGLKQFHVHMPSEERFDGKQFPAIVHLVHVSADDGIAVIAVPVRPGAENPAFDFEVPDGPDQGVRTSGTVNPADLLPESDLAYRYQGSLTTPPCTEGVIWTVFEQPITLSPEQLATLGSAHSGNARPVQPSNGRSVKLGPALAD